MAVPSFVFKKEGSKVADKLTAKQQMFCDEYLIDLNATQAAIRAGYSAKNAGKIGPELLGKTRIQNYINIRKKERTRRTELSQDNVLKELAYIAFCDVTDYTKVIEKELMVEIDGTMCKILDEDGNPVMYKTVEPVLTDELTDEQKKALAVIQKGRDGFVIKPYDKIRALELLGKHMGMFTEKVEVSTENNNPFSGLSTEELKKMISDG